MTRFLFVSILLLSGCVHQQPARAYKALVGKVVSSPTAEYREYHATVISVYDADTITADIDLGFGVILHKQKIRLYGINAPEVRGPEKLEGYRSRDVLREKIMEKVVVLRVSQNFKKGKYGRWLAEIYADEQNLNNWLVDEGFAKVAEY